MRTKISVLVALLLCGASAYGQARTGEDRDRRDQDQAGQQSQQSSSSVSSPAGTSATGTYGTSQQQSGTQDQRSQLGESTQPGQSSTSSGSLSSQPGQPGSTTPGTSSPTVGAPPGSQTGAQPGQPGFGTSQTGTQPGQPGLGTSPSSQSQTGTQPGQPGSISQPGTPRQTESRFDASAQGRPGAQTSGSAYANVQVNQQHVTRLQNSFSQIRTGGADQKQQLNQTIMGLSPGSRVSQEYVTRFVTDLTTVLPRATLSATGHHRLATAVAYVMTPNIQATQLELILTDVRQVLVQSGVSSVAAQTIACDLHLLAAEANPDLLEVRISP